MDSPLSALPALPDTAEDRRGIAAAVASGLPKLVVLDDDPTGTQTVHGVEVLTEWSTGSLARALADQRSCFYILTNSRSLDRMAAKALNREIAENLKQAAAQVHRTFVIASRSDSTLRGHFPDEVEVWFDALGRIDNVILVPAFFEGGRYTIDDVHYVATRDRLVPAAETEFARDVTFGYRHSNLREWVEEKTGGRIRASEVESIGIHALRLQGATGVAKALLNLPRGKIVVVNAAAYGDLEIFVHGLVETEKQGRRYIFRTAAGFVRVRAGIPERPLLTAQDLIGPGGGGALVVVGSYVANSTTQLEQALTLPQSTGIEFPVDQVLDECQCAREIERVAAESDRVVRSGRVAIVYTTRKLQTALGRAGEIGVAQRVSRALVGVVKALQERPRSLIAKGGITSSDLAVNGLGVRKAEVLGQAAPGIPVWKLGAEARFPDLPYVIFPGNVGGPATLRDLIARAMM